MKYRLNYINFISFNFSQKITKKMKITSLRDLMNSNMKISQPKSKISFILKVNINSNSLIYFLKILKHKSLHLLSQ